MKYLVTPRGYPWHPQTCHLIPTSQLATAPGGGEPLHSHGPQGTEEETAFVSTPATTILARLLPDAITLRLDTCHVDAATAQITVSGRSTPATAPCPLCTIPAHRIHSHYERTLGDLPWLTSRTLFRSSKAILLEPLVEQGE